MRRASSNKGKVYVEYTLTVSLMLGVAITSSTYMAGINDALFRRAEDRISQTLRNLDGAEPLSEVADANTEISPSPDENLEPSVDEAPVPEDGDNEDPAEEGDQSSEADDGLDASENSSETPEVDSDTPEHAEEDEAADPATEDDPVSDECQQWWDKYVDKGKDQFREKYEDCMDDDSSNPGSGNNGHGNDADGNDNSNPGNSNDPDDHTDDDGAPGGGKGNKKKK